MGLPSAEKAEITQDKIVRYLLSTTHRAGRSKAAFFGKHGFKMEDWQALAEALRRHAAESMVYKPEDIGAAVRDRASAEKEISMIRELDDVVLECDLPRHGLKRGDVGTVVLVHQNGAGCEVEFTALDGETLAVVTLSAGQFREVTRSEIAHARGVARVA